VPKGLDEGRERGNVADIYEASPLLTALLALKMRLGVGGEGTRRGTWDGRTSAIPK